MIRHPRENGNQITYIKMDSHLGGNDTEQQNIL
jgi:hypothetical protein